MIAGQSVLMAKKKLFYFCISKRLAKYSIVRFRRGCFKAEAMSMGKKGGGEIM